MSDDTDADDRRGAEDGAADDRDPKARAIWEFELESEGFREPEVVREREEYKAKAVYGKRT